MVVNAFPLAMITVEILFTLNTLLNKQLERLRTEYCLEMTNISPIVYIVFRKLLDLVVLVTHTVNIAVVKTLISSKPFCVVRREVDDEHP